MCQTPTGRCVSSPVVVHFPCCEQPVPNQPNACDGTESLSNPTSCTVQGNPVTYQLTSMEVETNCHVGYDIDGCDGSSCFPGGLAPFEGVGGVDNALGGLAPLLDAIGQNLGGVNQVFSDGICGMTRNDDCMTSIAHNDIKFVIDANPDENCANVTVRANGTASSPILNLSDDGCVSGTLGDIPLTIGWVEGQLSNTVVRMTVTGAGFSGGQLGTTIDEQTAVDVMEAMVEGGGAVAAQVLDINASTPPTKDTLAACNALSATLVIGGVAQ